MPDGVLRQGGDPMERRGMTEMGTCPDGCAVLMRHGAPETARPGCYLGRTDVPLSAEGRDAAERMAERLAGRNIGRIVASPLLRARQTADIAAERLDVTVVETDARLREIDFGVFEGKTYAEVARDYPEETERWRRDPDRFVFPDGEAVEDCAARVFAAADAWRGRLEMPTLVVAHAGTLRLLASRWLGLPPSSAWAVRFDYAGWGEIRFSGGPLGELTELRSGMCR